MLGPYAGAQTAPVTPLTLQDAVTLALEHHPRLREALANEGAADARVDEARLGLLPSAGVSAEINRSTGNTVPGAFFTAPGFVPIAGSPRGKSLDDGVFETGASVWASWDVLSLVRQAAAIDLALATRARTGADEDAGRLDVAYAAADAFIGLLGAQEAVKAAQADLERAQVFDTVVKTLVGQSLRPGADEARADAELALARTQLIRAEQNEQVRRAELAQAMGMPAARPEAIGGALADPPAPATPSPSPAWSLAHHPLVRESAAAAQEADQQKRAAELEYLPRLELVAALWARGSGFYDSPASGLVPDTPNWAAGAVLTWSILDVPKIRARSRAAAADQEAAQARYDGVVLAISSQLTAASAVLEGARRAAENTPVALASARAAETQARARYAAGLASAVDVADAQRLLARAELEDLLARLDVRRAQLLLARSAGDLGPFMATMAGRRPAGE